MVSFRRFVLESIRPRTASVASTLVSHAGIAPVPAAVHSIDESSFVPTLLSVLGAENVPIDTFHSATRAVSPLSRTALTLNLPVDAITDLVEEVIARSKEINDKVAAAKGYTFENTIKLLGDEDRTLQPLVSSFDFPSHVSADKAVRDASSAADTKWSAFCVETSMRKDVFLAVQKYAAKKEALDVDDQRLLDRIIRDFKRNGLDLDAATQERITAIKKEISELGILFSKNLGEENTKLFFDKAELDGLPADFIDRLTKREEDGKFEVSLKYPDAVPVLKLCHVDTTRAAMEAAFNSRCKDTNAEILDKLVKLRHEQALLLGFPNHASYILDVRMAKTPETVQTFLNTLNQKLQPLLDHDMKALLAIKEKTKLARNEPFDGKLHPYDMSYYINLIELEQYQVDHEALKKFFPLHVVTKGLFEIYQKLLGLRFVEVTEGLAEQVWHPDVKMYAVHDARNSDALVGHFFMDLHPRDGKYGHAAVFGLQPQAEGQKPAAALVANFSKPTAEKPSLLLHSEVVTYFHEFGHVFHQICSNVKWARFAGTSVERDFVECPSQMLENWCWEAETLNMLAGHIDDSTRKIPADLLERLIASKNANSGYTENRQLLFGLFDQAIHSGLESDIRTLWPEMQKRVVGLDATPGTFFPAAFGHLAGGYDAQYYGYMWSQVYATDMFFARFKEGKLLDAKAGADYRDMILARGGSRDAIDSLREFLGREPSQDAFLKSKGL
ncbi:hypothetical protein HDU81_010135 [Chytriomyces hyalinus]|nr:hypothetical protein HDU81_010135 [Chytriomyces hyalinus]